MPRVRSSRPRKIEISDTTSGMRKRAGAYIRGEAFYGVPDGAADIHVLSGEGRFRVSAQAEDVMSHEYLAVAVRARPDADDGDVQTPGDFAGDVGGHALDYERKRSSILKGDGIGDQLELRFGICRLAAESTLLMYGLGQKSEMPHHGDPRGNNPLDGGRRGASAFQLHR